MRIAVTFSSAALIATLLAGPVLAKLPPLSDDAKAKAAEAASKAAWTDKVGAYKLCLSMDHVAEVYRKEAKAAGKDASATAAAPACTDPGPYAAAATPAASKPLEASGAHSPAGMATSPPSTNATAAQMSGGPKK
jgi:hypothetical protein